MNELSRYFSSSSSVPGADGVESDQGALPILECEFKFERVEEEEVLKLLQSLDTNKAMGLDGIDSKILRMAAPAIS